jgi:PhzF family phenazine biosynthesis protein
VTSEPPADVPGTLLRLAAFTADPRGGNPAGVWIGDALPPPDQMQRIAADVGYSETAFLAPDGSGLPGRFRVRYFSPLAEVPFCGHATIASGVALSERGLAAEPVQVGATGGSRQIVLETNGGPVAIATEADEDGLVRATLTSVATWVREPEPALTAAALELLGWRADDLDPLLPPAVGFAGAKHRIIAARELERLERLEYPFEALKALMLEHDLTTIQLVWRESAGRLNARDPFPVGGIVEDPATGAAAAALGAYLRDRGEIVAPASFEIVQGIEMGRPSLLTVSIAPGEAGVRVSGTAVAIP